MTEEEFKALLPEELRANPSIAKFKDPVALAKSYVEAQSLLGSSIRPPGAEATPEAKADFRKKLLEKVGSDLVYAPEGDEGTEAALYARLGRPEKPDAYEVAKEAADAGLNAEELRALAAAVGLTRKQFQALQKTMIEPTLAQKQKAAEEAQALKTEWGVAHPERVADAKAAAVKMGFTQADADALTPAQLRVFANVAKAVGGGGAPFTERQPAGGGKKTPTEALAEIEEIMQRAEYFRPQPHQRGTHERLKSRVAELMPMAYPE